MSRVIYSTTLSGPKWSAESAILQTVNIAHGPLSIRQGVGFGASSSSVILGPDLALPGTQLNNPPSVADYPWSPPPTFGGGPPVTFAQDITYTAWIRGHLINGRWGGPGSTWTNLTPLTSVANSNHKSAVESHMDRFLINSLNYEQSGNRTHWYAIFYSVQCSANPFAAVPNNADLYSYAPEFIKVSWRAVSILKPVNQSVHAITNNLLFAGVPMPVPILPFPLPAAPAIAGWPLAVIPAAGNVAGGPVLGALPIGFPAVQGNGFDGDIEIHQS